MLDRLPFAQPLVERAYAALILLAVLGTTGYALSRPPSFVQTVPGAHALRAAHEPNDQQAPAKSAARLAVGAIQAASDAEKLAAHYRTLAESLDAGLSWGAIHKTIPRNPALEQASNHSAEHAAAGGNLY